MYVVSFALKEDRECLYNLIFYFLFRFSIGWFLCKEEITEAFVYQEIDIYNLQ